MIKKSAISRALLPESIIFDSNLRTRPVFFGTQRKNSRKKWIIFTAEK